MYCKNCGNEISNTATFCDGCGERIVRNAQKKKEQEERFANEQASDTKKPIRSGGDDREGYRLFADRLVIAKKGKLETIQMSDIASAKLSFGSVYVVKKNQKEVGLMSLKKEEIADWINDINRYTQGEGNFVPMSQATAMEAVKSFNKKAIIVVVAIAAVVLFFIFSGGNSNFSDDSVMSSDEITVEKIKAEDDYGLDISGTVSFKKDVYYGYALYISAYDKYDNVIASYKLVVNGSFKAGSKNDFSDEFRYDENTDHFKLEAIAAD